ncbi:BPL-N domain-containing protein [Rubripirellula reticaptiva]|uniref:N-formylglutamate amidohydrolase n=1 Tax=Rubripirellula reticaptiva TaxID=2528013 RepID=A0A5C6EKP9_9BACT|nr:BPL-N domain-containing protein [Rubripirellula reticaptiva]TWU49060.1 N-formylglutamate amidohydrolase [Rubripirellula reticaptiva]
MQRLPRAAFLSFVCIHFLSYHPSHAAGSLRFEKLIQQETGELPIILSAPHGGRQPIPGVHPRQGVGVKAFNSIPDLATDRLTETLADAIEKAMGKRPYVVIARFNRKYADANRREPLAYESENAKQVYQAYHAAIAEAKADVIERWGRGVLLDIHGQSTEPSAIFRGTANGKTTTHLVNRFGQNSLTGKESLFGNLARNGFRVIPAVGSNEHEHSSYNGGYIVNAYGSRSGGTLDAIQLEIGRDLRLLASRPQTAEKLAKSIAVFACDYLPVDRDAPAVDAKADSNTVCVGVYIDEGAGPSVNDLLSVLGNFKGVSVTRLTADDIRSGKLAELDLVMHPGGSGSAQGRHLGDNGREAIRNFVQDGGGFVGICAGAYFATSHYPWSLNILDAKVVDTKHWNRGNGTVDIALTDAGNRLLRTKVQKLAIHYAQGPLLAPGNRPDIEDYQIVAAFETEIAKNGAPVGVMKGTTAIAEGKYGSGCVICFSPHPEMTSGLEPWVRFAIDHVKRSRSAGSN